MNTAGEALEMRHQGRYEEADRVFQVAYQASSGGVETADLLFNWADAVARLPGQEDRACAMFQEAADILWPNQYKNPKVYAAYVHHRARFFRGLGYQVAALKEVENALRQIRRLTVRDRRQWVAPYIDNLTVRLDTSSIRALNDLRWEARAVGLSALAWSLHPWLWVNRQVRLRHVVRAVLLLVYAGKPRRSQSVQRAFFGSSS